MNSDDVLRMKQRFQIVGNCLELNRAIDVAIQVATTDLSVLITGESGTGKENIPKIIHANSLRKNRQYIAVNCGSIPEGTVDSELFGHEKGAFTGAVNERKGYFDEANGGTIFLDEVAELPLATQARLLRVLETGEFIKVGSSKVQKTDVRIVAATNVDLPSAIEQGRFREDLYYRLNTIPIKIPPLRERGTDIILLFRKFAADCAEKYRTPLLQLADDAKQALMENYWPGNVRQLKNVTEQMSIMSDHRLITADDLRAYLPDRRNSMLPVATGQASQAHSFENEREILYKVLFDLRRDVTDLKEQLNNLTSGNAVRSQQPQPVPIMADDDSSAASVVHISGKRQDYIPEDAVVVNDPVQLAEMECEMIKQSLSRNNGHRKNAARELGISERTLYRKIKDYDIQL